jgi:hypothetical protein
MQQATHGDRTGGRRRVPFIVAAVAALTLLAVGCVPPPATPPAGGGGGGGGGSGVFDTLAPGSALPGDQECRSRVRPAAEVRPSNAGFNQAVGHATAAEPPYFSLASRVTGNFTGTTDEIIQWAACKWGINEDVVRAQLARESWWYQSATGDYTSNPADCAPFHPIGADGRPGQCPESIGLGQVRTQYFRPYINDSTASSAYNLDIVYATWRSCFEGHETWLNDVERGSQYGAGDLWGCVGRWYSGRWHTAAANEYIGWVQDYLNQRVWTTPGFLAG